jgi:hypothetical protein
MTMEKPVGSQRRRRARPPVVAMVGAGLAVVAGACGGGSAAPASHSSPRQVVLSSIGRTESASSAAIGLTVSVKGTPRLGGVAGSGTPVSISISGQGLFSFADKTGQMTLTIASAGGSTQTVKVEEIGNHLYVSDAHLSSLVGGKPWVEFDLSAFRQAEGQSGNPLGSLSDGDPTQILGLLQHLAGSVSEVGTGEVDGVPTTEYQGTIDLAGGGAGSSVPTLISPNLARTLGLSNIPVDVWVDGAGRARQVSTSFLVVGLTIEARGDFGSFGTPVSVTPPPAGEVADGSGLLQHGQAGSLFGSGSTTLSG